MTDSSIDQLKLWDSEHVWHAFTQMANYEPLVIDSASGCVLTDIQGNTYIDAVSSLWCNVHGHQHPVINAAIRQQLDQVAHVTSLGMSNPTTIQLAKRLVDITPENLNHLFFSGDGSSSVEVAMKMAFQYWQQKSEPQPNKTQYIALGSAYHGDTLGSVSVGGVQRFHEMFKPLLFDVLRLDSPDTYRLPDGVMTAQDATQFYLNQLESLLQQHHSTIAAMIIEPVVQGAAGMIIQPPGYLAGVRQLTQKHDVLLIADEVAVGFGRTGAMFACNHEDIQPDLMCLAKGLTGGYITMAATLATTEIWKAFLGDSSRTFYHGHTYSGNPLAAAAALANLDIFETEQTMVNVHERTEQLADLLKPLTDHPHVGDVRQAGLIVAIELVADKDNKTSFENIGATGSAVCKAALEQGVWLRPLRDTIVIMPPLSISESEITQIATVVEHAICGVLDG
ncbi:adenosylmethionine--8-amino-7-oxononanoate transaminase [Pirellulaceae bacterium]|jgi:adenosylmethionine-8-amino-7-oxononanoate aminotransferase|nr:adenosylmethionine--8-amino-7-oxononanoate transaminase [Pirellulaceae bacterium]